RQRRSRTAVEAIAEAEEAALVALPLLARRIERIGTCADQRRIDIGVAQADRVGTAGLIFRRRLPRQLGRRTAIERGDDRLQPQDLLEDRHLGVIVAIEELAAQVLALDQVPGDQRDEFARGL